MALKKNLRLKKKKDIQAVKQQGKIYHTPLFSVLYLDNQKRGLKFGFVVSKKIDKIAVNRNKIRRRLSEAVRRHLPKIKDNLFILFLVKKSIKQADFKEIEMNLLKVNPILRKKDLQ